MYILGFEGLSISVAATQLRLCSVKTATEKAQNEQAWLCSNEAIYKNRHLGQVWSLSHGLPKPTPDSNFFH